METRISRAAYAAEDAIECHIFDQLTTNNNGENWNSYSLYEALEKVIEDMALIEKEAMEIKETVQFKNQLHIVSTPFADSSGSTFSSSIHKIKSRMVGAADVLLELKDKLTCNSHDLQTIPIVGMGGSGKTTLALHVYQDRLIEEHFDIRALVTVSQEYNIGEILKQVLTQLNRYSSGGELGEILYKHLYGRKYMIILDDMWSLEAWDGVRMYLPNNKNGSRIVITTRLTTLASALPNSNILGMKLLDGEASWDLLSKTVFGKKSSCPPEFEKIGKKIVKGCKGLPLSIVVVGGLLAKSEQSIESWENIEKNLNEIVNLDDNEHCLKTLYMSYKQLPVHLKPCFLYMGIYREDHVIPIKCLIQLWVAEGFLRPMSGKRPEDVAREYLEDLISRNLILIHKLGSTGSIKFCKIHDLLRDLCLRESQKQGLYTVYPGHEIQYEVSRIVMSSTIMAEIEENGPLLSMPRARSLILNIDMSFLPSDQILRFVRIVGSYNILDVGQLVNSRFFTSVLGFWTTFPGIIWLFWNLRILVIHQFDYEFTAPSDIWYMSHIRHILIYSFHLPDPPPNVQANGIVLANLQTLGRIRDFKCSEQIVKTIPNVRKLHISYDKGVDERFCLTNLDRLDKLQSLFFYLQGSMMCRINYPRSLKKLTLVVERSQSWQDILDKIGELPLLEKLKLNYGTFKGQWEETTDGQFRSLKSLSLYKCEGLRVWTSEASHFPRLEHLHLSYLKDLEEIPSDFGEIPTLKLIDLFYCSDSAVESAKRVLEKQEELYGEEDTTLQIEAWLSETNDRALKSFWSPKFYVR